MVLLLFSPRLQKKSIHCSLSLLSQLSNSEKIFCKESGLIKLIHIYHSFKTP